MIYVSAALYVIAIIMALTNRPTWSFLASFLCVATFLFSRVAS